MPLYESSMRNLARARERGRPPRPWRSSQEAQMIRRYVFWWLDLPRLQQAVWSGVGPALGVSRHVAAEAG